MKQVEVKGTVGTAFERPIESYKDANGNPLQPLTFSGFADVYETPDECKAKNDWLSDDEILIARNAKRVQQTRSKLTAQAIKNAGIVEPTLKDVDVAIKAMADVYVAQGLAETLEEGKELARKALGK